MSNLEDHADRDVAEFRGELRAQTNLINLTRQDMGEVRNGVEALRTEMVRRFDQLHGGMEQIVRLLEGPR